MEKENKPNSELEKIIKEKDEYLDGWKRSKAELINYKKDEMERLQEIARYANEDLIYEMIGVLDNFELGLAALEKSGPVEKGIYMIKTQIEDLLRKRGLKKIETKIGDKFDPKKHEAVSVINSDKPEGTIIEIIENGYSLNEKILRPTRVKTSKQK